MNYANQLRAAQRQYESESAYDEDDEARQEWIDDHARLIAADLLKDEAFVMDALESDEGQTAILRDAGRFFARFRATDDASEMASIAFAFYRDLLPYVEAAAKEQAETEVAAEYDRQEAA